MLGERSGSERAKIASVGEGDPRKPGDPGHSATAGTEAAHGPGGEKRAEALSWSGLWREQ